LYERYTAPCSTPYKAPYIPFVRVYINRTTFIYGFRNWLLVIYGRYADRIRSIYGFKHRVTYWAVYVTVYGEKYGAQYDGLQCENRLWTVYDQHTVPICTEPNTKTIYERYAVNILYKLTVRSRISVFA